MAIENAFVRDWGRPSPWNNRFKKDYVIIFPDRKKIAGEYLQAWNHDIGFESNISESNILEETKPVSKKEAEEFVDFMIEREDNKYNIRIIRDPYDTRKKRVGKFKDFLDL